MKTALLVIDAQMAFVEDDLAGAERSCPQAEKNIATLISQFRKHGETIIHIHHHGLSEDDPFHPGNPGAAVQPFAAPAGDEATYIKHVASAFVISTLEQDLRKQGIERLVITGATANHCAESTARSAGNLGFETIYVSDAVWAYAADSPDGSSHSAETIHSVTLSNLPGEFAIVMASSEASALVG